MLTMKMMVISELKTFTYILGFFYFFMVGKEWWRIWKVVPLKMTHKDMYINNTQVHMPS